MSFSRPSNPSRRLLQVSMMPWLIAFCCACSQPPETTDLPAPRPLGRQSAATTPDPTGRHDSGGSGTAHEGAPPPSPSGPLNLTNALALALQRNPELNAAAREVKARQAEATQAGLRPNPELVLEVENFAGTGEAAAFDAAETTLGLSQTLELGGKRRRRLGLARQERALAAWNHESRRLDLVTEVKRAFTELLAAQERVQLAESLISVAEQMVDSVARRVRAGALSPVEETRARIELAISRVERDLALRERTTARRQLAATWGDTSVRFDRAVGAFDVAPRVPDAQRIYDRLTENPDLARWGAELDRHRAEVALERSMRLPDVSLGGGVRWWRESEETAFLVEVGLPLPLFDRNQGAIRAAEHRLAMGNEEFRAVQVRTNAALATTYEELGAAAEEAVTVRDHILPEATTAAATARDAYDRGLFTLTDVLDTQRSMFELRSRLVDALTRYHLAVADMERLTGQPFENLVQTEEEER